MFRTIKERSWGARGGAVSILALLSSGVFSDERAAAIRKAVAKARLA